MALRATPTIAICLTAGIAAGIALARPGDQAPAATASVAEPAAEAPAQSQEGDSDSPYLVDGDDPAVAAPRNDVVAETAAPVAISIEGFDFSPVGSVTAGSPIAVTNLDGANHTLTATNGEFDTGTLGENDQAIVAAPAAAGSYEFFCAIHPSMTGELVVS